MSNQIPERLINFAAYLEGNRQAGVATVELPDIEMMTDTVSGAGIAGEMESAILGHTASMSTTITWRTITSNAAELAKPGVHALEFRGSQQINDAANGRLTSLPVRVAMRVTAKRIGLGTFEVGATTDTETEFEVQYLKLDVGGATRLEIDKLNFKFVVGGEDYLASVRADLGL